MKWFNGVKQIVTGVIIGLSALSLVACSSGNDEGDTSDKTEISLYSSGSKNVEEFWEEVIPMFEEEHDHIEVEFVFVPSGTGGQSTMDRILAANESGNDSGVDIYEGSLEDILRGKEDGDIFYPLTSNNIENLSNVQESNLAGANDLAVPYRASSVVLAYNEETVTDIPDTAEELYQWIKDHPGRFAYNDPSTGGAGSSFVLSTVYNQLEEGAMDIQDESIMEEWGKGFDLLNELAPNMYQEGVYPKKNQGTLDLLANGEVDMIPAWSDMALEQINKGLLPESIKLKQIQPAFTGGPSYLMLANNDDEARKEAAEELLNYVLTTDVQEIVIDQMYGYPGIKWDLLSEEDQEKFADVMDGYRIFNGGELGGKLTEQWQKEVAAQ
ncbi:extracellular solute-binding protein [Gracilibacillus alcaliphilus]|uniref:extracellular solute-binding protein n=1 Tax=Gracilibacillus alcaliphilus TaxID=1401441 RepID=UPI0019585FA3|nr:extracellular solute-binding protein [Gracilibacillus alcaliphilus]MBM7677540.1 putative spermidine/putrescine transport system substrate-binding protein [Gracilibacillus alcaliphilus]